MSTKVIVLLSVSLVLSASVEQGSGKDESQGGNRTQSLSAPSFIDKNMMAYRYINSTAGRKSQPLKCLAEGNPPPKYKWIKTGEKLPLNVLSGVYTIDNPTPSDNGDYTCIVSNSEGRINFTFTVFVGEAVGKPQLKAPMLNLSLQIGESGNFTCDFDNIENGGIRWHVQSKLDSIKNITPGIGGVQFKIPHVYQLHNVSFKDEGNYTCEGSNEKGYTYASAYFNIKNKDSEPSNRNATNVIPVMLAIILLMVATAGVIWMVYIRQTKYVERRKEKKGVPLLTEMYFKKEVIVKISRTEEDFCNSISVDIIDCSRSIGENPLIPAKHYKMPNQGELEFPPDKLFGLNDNVKIGEGQYGEVIKATARGIGGRDADTIVAVKKLKDGCYDDLYMKNLVSEMEMMKMIGSHRNIVNLLGCCSQDGELLVIMEYAHRGDLLRYLREFRLSEPSSSGYALSQPSPMTLVGYILQIAEGMEYLAMKKCLHRDLAARNVLVTDGEIMKIADFGLARSITNGGYYRKKTDNLFPYRWMAVEVLENDSRFRLPSDVWSFGVLMWEVMDMGHNPPCLFGSTKVTNEQILQIGELKRGTRLPKPPYCPDKIYNLMLECWNIEADERPTFSEIVEKLKQLILDAEKGSLICTSTNSLNHSSDSEYAENGSIYLRCPLSEDENPESVSPSNIAPSAAQISFSVIKNAENRCHEVVEPRITFTDLPAFIQT